MRLLTLAALAVTLTGCSGIMTSGDEINASSGAAAYTYKKQITHPDGTVETLEVSATSARELTDASLTILEDGSMESTVAKTEGGSYGQEMALELIKRIPVMPGSN